MRNLLLPLVLGAALIAALYLGLSIDRTPVGERETAVDTAYGLGEAVPDFSFTALEGTTMTLSEYAAGDPVVVVARDALCPVSRRYGPTTGRLSREFRDAARFLYINVSPLDTPERMTEDRGRYDLVGAYAHDPEWRIAALLGVITTGEVFLVDRDGVLRYRGAIDDQYGIRFTKPEPRNNYLEDALDQLLGGKTVTNRSTLPEGCYLASDIRHYELN